MYFTNQDLGSIEQLFLGDYFGRREHNLGNSHVIKMPLEVPAVGISYCIVGSIVLE